MSTSPARCPRCEFSYAWDGRFCGHCHNPYPRRARWETADHPSWFTRHHRDPNYLKLCSFLRACVQPVVHLLPLAAVELFDRLGKSAGPRAWYTRLLGGGPAAEARRILPPTSDSAEGQASAALRLLVEVATGESRELVESVLNGAQYAARALSWDRLPITPDELVSRPTFLPDTSMWVQTGTPHDWTAEQRQEVDAWREATRRGYERQQWRRQIEKQIQASQCDLYRDLFLYPFEPTHFHPGWRTPGVVELATAMDVSSDFSGMPILGDALEEAGCESAELLDHCRAERPHLHGCWLIGLVLGQSS